MFNRLAAKYGWRGLPWATGYSDHKNRVIESVLSDPDMMKRFRETSSLPDGYGDRLDERVVEYPWVFARLNPKPNDVILDAGSTFSAPFLLKSPYLAQHKLIIYTLMTDYVAHDRNVSYIFGDFRDMLLKDQCVDLIACISTLEHVGMGQDYKAFNLDRHADDEDIGAYHVALREFGRILRTGGRLLLTLPYGKRENHGWLQQYDEAEIESVIRSFSGELLERSYYLYAGGGWQIATAQHCKDANYFNIHAAEGFDSDFAAAARAVVCLAFQRS
jgi:hypothetical protein